MVSRCPEKPLEDEKILNRKKYPFVHLGHWTRKFWPLSENLVRVCQSCILHSLWNFSRKSLYWIFFSFSDTLRRYFGVLPINWQCRQKCNLRIQRSILRVVFEKIVFSSFSDIEWKYFDLLSNSFSWSFQKCNFRIQMITQGKLLFLEKVYFLFIFGHCAKIFWSSGRIFCRNCQNCLLHSPLNFSRKSLYWFFFQFRTLCEDISAFCQ